MDGHGINLLLDGWERDKSFITWMGTGYFIYQMDGYGILHLTDGLVRDKSFIRWMGTA